MSVASPAPLVPIKRISPSRFYGLKQCALREAWRSSGAPALLPKSPGAWLGQAIHSLLEKAGKREVHDLTSVQVAWNSLVADAERAMESSLLGQHLVPLERNAPHFEVRKRQAFKLALAMIATRPAPASGGRGASELWLQTEDGQVGGKVDRVLISADGVIIVDFKTGAIIDPISGQVKPEYRVQLMLYASLYKTMKGVAPKELQLIGLDGVAHSVAFSMVECDALLKDARDSLMAVNGNITSSKLANERIADLATPTGSTCLYCEFRPVCGPYLTSMQTPVWQASEPRPIDVRGTVTDFRVLGNGRLWIRLTTITGESKSIRGLSPDRHPALNNSTRNVALFSLNSDSVPGTYTENQMTTVYAS